MVPWWIFLVIHFAIGSEQENCGRTKVDFPAPVFGPGDNLSADGCGIWNDMDRKFPPWMVTIWRPRSSCEGILISPTTVLSADCGRYEKSLARSEIRDGLEAGLGRCNYFRHNPECVNNGEGQNVKVLSVTQLKAPGYPRPLHLWKIKKPTFKEYSIAPICISNKGNQHDFDKTPQYKIEPELGGKYMDYPSAELSENVGFCQNGSRDFRTCDKVHQNFLCARSSSRNYHGRYMVHDVKNRLFLRALQIEQGHSLHEFFFYDLYPLLDQIVSASSDLNLMPKIPEVKKQRVDFGANQSFPGCGTLNSNRRHRNSSTEGVVPLDNSPEAHNQRHQQPWHVALVNKRDRNVFCGATLVSPTALVTAAHCVVQRDPTSFVVIADLHNLADIFENKGTQQELKPYSIFVHENYTHDNLDNDVAVILVEAPGFKFTSNVRPICLWNQDYDLKDIEGTTGKVVGWGFDENQTRPDVLQTVNLQLKSYMDCFMNNKLFFNKYLKPGHNFCAARNESTVCGGNSGGGFAIERDGKWFLRGVVSSENTHVNEKTNVTECELRPTLYADVANYMDWIVQRAQLQVMKKN